MFSEKINQYKKKNNFQKIIPKAVLFDMDGVLFDSMRNHADSWVKAMQRFELPFTKEEAYMNEGRTGHSTINGVFQRELGRNATEEEKQEIYCVKSQFFDACPPAPKMPYAQELLEKIKSEGLQILVVTGSGQPSLLNSLQHHFPDIFEKEKMVTAFDVKMGKPHPEPYLMGLKKAGVEPWEAIVVENAPLGVAASSAADIFTIGVNTGPLNKDILYNNGADVVLDSMEELYCRWDAFATLWKI